MDIQPILAAMRRNKFGAILICIQMAITLAVLCNAIFVIEQRSAWIQRPTGVDEPNIFTMRNKWIGEPEQDASRTKRDLAALRGLAGVADAYASNSYPLLGGGDSGNLGIHADQRHPTATASDYFADDHAVRTLGLKLVAGRNFSASEVIDPMFAADFFARLQTVVIVSQPLAQALYPHESAVGKPVYLGIPHPATIVGVVERLEGPYTRAGGYGSSFMGNSMLIPFRYAVPEIVYIVRAQPGRLAGVMRDAQRLLTNADPLRVLRDVNAMSDTRRESHRDDYAFVLVLAAVCIVMLAVTALGIVGLTSYWVTQRRRQIGIRRALGGTRIDILRYFQTENLLIAVMATLFGCALTVGFNLWAVSTFEMARLPYHYLAFGGATILLLGQIAAFWPALRASLVPPALATRSV
jgi:putative ABC transport system permease protein